MNGLAWVIFNYYALEIKVANLQRKLCDLINFCKQFENLYFYCSVRLNPGDVIQLYEC